jgi:hypothetical protein
MYAVNVFAGFTADQGRSRAVLERMARRQFYIDLCTPERNDMHRSNSSYRTFYGESAWIAVAGTV